MSILSLVVTFFLTFWTIVFLVIPASNDRKVAGAAYPDDPRIWQKFLVTAAISLLITLAIWALVSLDIFSFRLWADQWDK